MTSDADIAAHYTSGNLLDRLQRALMDDGVDPNRPTLQSLAPYDHFHGRGLEATRELADALTISSSDHLLDIGCGIGGPARYFADRFGCRATGIDLTPEFCDVARQLARALNLQDKVGFERGDALDMPFDDETFDGAYSMNVSMNIADKGAFYREIHRVLRPGAWLALSELAQGPGSRVSYPTPWALTSESSFLATPEDTRKGLEANGFEITGFRDATGDVLEFGARTRTLVEQGDKPPHRAVQLFHGDLSAEVSANVAEGVRESRLVPIEVVCIRS